MNIPKVFDTLNQHSLIVDLDSYVFFVVENQRSAATEKLLSLKTN